MAKKLFKAVYTAPRTFEKYGKGKIMLYPNETVIEDYQPEKQEGQEEEPPAYTGYQYEGEELNGGYIRECSDPTDLHELANAIVRTRYALSEELALQRHYNSSPEEYAEKWEAYNEFADKAATLARQWLGIEQ